MAHRKRDLVSSCFNLIEDSVKDALQSLQNFKESLKVIDSPSSTEDQRKSAYKEVTHILRCAGHCSEAILFTQLSVDPQPCLEAYVKSLLNNGENTWKYANEAIDEAKRLKYSDLSE